MMNYLPKVGDIIKIRSWHGIVLEVYRNEAGKTVLQVQTVRNIFRKLGPELMEVDIAPEQILPATPEDLRQEISLHQEMLENALEKFLSYVEDESSESLVKQVVEV